MYNKAVHERLMAAAKTEDEFVLYPEIIALAGLGHLTGDALSGALGRLFYAVIQQDMASDPARPMLSSVAFSSMTMTPGSGYYTLAREMERLHSKDEKQELAFWLNELKSLRIYWQNPPNNV